VVATVADDLVARYPAAQIDDALEVAVARDCSNTAGWLVRAISHDWHLRDEAARLRAARERSAQRQADAAAATAAQLHRDDRLTGWAAAIDAALPDDGLAEVVAQVVRPVEGVDRLSAPVAYTQILAWGIHAATTRAAFGVDVALQRALRAADAVTTTAWPDDIPTPPTPTDLGDPAAAAAALRDRVARAIANHDPPQA